MIRDSKIHKGTLPDANAYIRYCAYALQNRFKQTIDDYHRFPSIELPVSTNPFHIQEALNDFQFPEVTYHKNGARSSKPVEEFLRNTETIALLILKDNKLLFEQYCFGYERSSLFRLYSITKSVMSILVGIAVDKGLIESVNDSISKYLPGLRVSGIEELTIESLLLMHSGIYFTGIKMPFHEASKIYFTNNCRRLIKKIRISDPVDSYFHYNDYHLLLLTLIIENVTGKSLIDFLWENLLEPLGWEFPLLLTIDSTKNKFPKMESGVVCRAIDLAKLGLMLLNDGKVNNKNIVSTQWIKASTAPNTMVIEKEYYRHYKEKPWGRMCFYKGLGYYKYLWWGNPIDAMTYDFYAMGILGQFLYVSPRKNTVIIRLGKRWGIHGWLPQILKEIADKL